MAHYNNKKNIKQNLTIISAILITTFAAGIFVGINLSNQKVETLTINGQETTISTFFSDPNYNHASPQKAIINLIDNAQKSIYVALYSFTNRPIKNALIAAHKRGIKIYVAAEGSTNLNDKNLINDLINAGINVKIINNGRYQLMHNKFMIFDENTVETGSYNYTRAAEEKNAENILIIKNTKIAKNYLNAWQQLIKE